MTDKNNLIEKAYEEVGTNYRYFLNWRRFLITGWFTLMGAMSFGFGWIQKNADTFSWIIFISTFIITLVFWMMDYRNRDLYHACQESGEKLEQFLDDTKGIYTQLNNLKKPKISHSLALDVLYFTTMAAMLGGVVWSLCKVA